MYPNTQVGGGVLAGSGVTRDVCATTCDADLSCVAIDYDNVNSNCYTFIDQVPAVTAGNDVNYVHFRYCDAPVGSPRPPTVAPPPSTSKYHIIL